MDALERYKKRQEERNNSTTMDALERYKFRQTLNAWQKLNENASATINYYGDLISNGKWVSSDDLAKYNQAITDYVDSGNRFKHYYSSYGKFDEEDEKKWTDTVNGLTTNFDNARKYYEQFGSVEFFDDYNQGAESLQKEIEELTAAKTEIEALRGQVTRLKSTKGRGGNVSDIDIKSAESKLKNLESKYGDKVSGDYIARKRGSLNRINEMTEFSDLSSAKEFEDFGYYSAEGSKAENVNTYINTLSGDGIGWYDLKRSDIANIVTFAEENSTNAAIASAQAMRGGGDSGDLTNLVIRINQHMKDDEKAIYNYYIGKGDYESANRYFAHIEDVLLQREAGKTAEQVDNTFAELVFSAAAGLDSFFTGVGNIDNMVMGKDPDPTTSSTQYAQSMMSSNNSGLWGVANDLVNTLGNQLPSILVSYIPVVGQAVGLASMSASASGNAYAEMRNLGYTDTESRNYALMVGASEGALQYALGGISALGGKASGNVIAKAVSKVDNAIARTAIKWGGNMLSEGFEESIQSILEPIFKNIVTGAEVDVDWGEVAYSGLLGALSAGLLEGKSTIAGEVNTYKDGKVIKESGAEGIERLKSLGSTFSADTVAYQLAGKVNEQTGAYTIGRLLNEIGASLSEQNMADITSALEAKGVTSEDAKTIAKWLNKAVNGGNFSKSQIKALEDNEIISQVMREVIINPNSTVNQRNLGYNEVLYSLAKETTSPKTDADKVTADSKKPINVLSQNEVARRIAEASGADVSVVEKALAEKASAYRAGAVKIDVSKNGETIQKSTGKSITINKSDAIAKVGYKDGKKTVYLNTDNGVVESSDVSYASEAEGLIYESFVDLNPAFANAIIKNYDGKTPVQTYIRGMRDGILMYGRYNFQGVGKDISNEGFFAALSKEDQAFALKLGKNLASFDAKIADESRLKVLKNAVDKAREAKGISKDAPLKGTAKKSVVGFENGAKAKSSHKKIVSLAKHLSSALGLDIIFYDSSIPGTRNSDSNGYYDPDTDILHLDLNAWESDKKLIAYTFSHELVHWLKRHSETDFNNFAKFLMEQYAEHGVDTEALIQAHMDRGYTRTEAYEEMICEACETLLLDSNAVERLIELRQTDEGLFNKIKNFIRSLLDKIRGEYKKYGDDVNLSEEAKALLGMTDVLEQIYAKFEEAMVGAAKNAQMEQSLEAEANTDIVPVESTVKHSYKSLAKAAGFDAIEDENGNRAFIRDGKAVSKVTIEDIENSPIGAFINYSLDNKDITKEQADEQKKMFADICTLCCQTNDFSMTMQFVGSEIFTAMKANADKQYGTTYDMPSICTKTQAVIDAMSARMVKLGRGLSTEEITAIYNEVNHAGNPVPCPECYVFSRWIGIGSLLDNIKQYQEYYGKMSVREVAEAYKKMRVEIEASAKELKITFGKAKGALVKKYTSEYNKLTEKIEKQENQGEKVNEADRKKLKELESMQNTVKAMTWIENVYFADSALTKVNKNFKVPDEVLFDLNMGEKFATQYREAWAFRTTQGAGYGKAITPYAEVSLGEGILVTNNTSNAIKGKQNGTLNNYFLQQRGQMNADARKALDRARLKQKIQAFLGGQRFQSTSDARYENASDYLLAALEMQAMHGMVQVYTKVDGAVPAFEAWGFSSNQSLMPKNSGLDADGNVQDTSVGGMNPKVAIANRNKHEHAGTITIGVNDNHIRALFAMIERDFIIPYHASGGKADVVAEFRRIQEGLEKKGAMVRSTDYSRTQSDKVLSDDVLKWLGKTDAEIEQIHKVREARIAILTGGKPEMEVVRGNRFLSALYDKFHGGEWDGVKLAKGKISSQIFPNEYWDQNVTYEESGQITRDYLEYCEDLGFLHRFSGLVPSNGMLVPINGYDENGNRVALTDLAFKYKDGKKTNVIEDFYWKVLTDRRMYGHNGQYLPQQIVTLAKTTEDTVTSFAKNNDGRQYNKELSLATAEKVSSETWGNIVEEVGAESIPEATEQYTDVENTTRIKKQQKKTSDNTYENIGKELMYYEEGDLAPDLTLVETINDRTGNKEVTIKHHGQKPKDYVPKKIAYCYKLFEQHPDGTLHALFAGAKNGVPLNEWRYAQGFPRTDEGVKGMNLRERYGWHLSAGLPSAPHLMSSKYFERGYPSKGAYGHPKGSKRVWVRMAYDASTDFNSIADSTGRQNDIYGLIPFGGYYAFKENNQSEWVISSAVKIDKILKEEERQQILKEAGYDEYEAWRLKYQPTPEERAARGLANKERAKAKARAKKLGTDTELAESTKAMRDSIKSRIIDNPELKNGIKKQAKKNTDRILMGSLFSGGGTLEAGLTYQMLDKEFGVEYDGKIASVYADNHGDHIQVGKVEDFDISKYKDIFYLHASPVCHNFSKAKHGAAELQMDKDSARATAMHLEMGMPQVFTVENAPGYRKSESLKIITDKLTELGYKWDVDVYNSADYGSATSRNRVILRAVKDGELPPKPAKQERTNSWDKVTRDLWDTLPKSNLRPSFISAIENTKNLPILDANGKVNVNKPLLILTTTSGHTVTFCWEGEVCPTLTTKCGEAKLVMPDGNIYAVTPEFMGRIQGLPDDYKYPKEKTRAFTIIGNGIPTHLTKAVVGGVLDSAYEQTHGGKILYQKKKVTDRTILANALELTADISTQKGQNELKMLREYQSKIAEMEKEEAHLAEVKAEIYKITFTKGSDRSKLASLNDDKIKTQNRIHIYDRKLTELEAMKPIRDVLEREKELVREKGREALKAERDRLMKVQDEIIGSRDYWTNKYHEAIANRNERIKDERVKKNEAVAKVRESRDKQEARAKLDKLVLETIGWLTHPAKEDVRCPDMLKEPYHELLKSINLDSQRALSGGALTKNDLRIDSAMHSLASIVERIRNEQITDDGEIAGFLDLPENYVKVLRDMAEAIKKMMPGGYAVVNTMTSDEVKQLTKLIRTLNSSIKKMNTLHANLRFANAQMLGDTSITFLDSMGKAEKTNKVKDFVTWDNALPYYAFKKFGEGGESIFEELMDAQDKMAFNSKTILDFSEKAWTDEEANEWSKDTHTIALPSGVSLTLTTADAMGIYCLARRDNGVGINHLTGGGVRVVGLTKGATKMQDSEANLTLVDIEEIIDSLSDRQKKVAEAIQEFMSTVCSEWGNEISMKRFLTKDFTEKVYYPVESADENLNAELPDKSQSDLYRLLNISATKSLTEGANNRVVIRNIFDVFTNHTSDMARLNAYGMAILDYMKWINYREKTITDDGQVKTRGVRQSMNSTYGEAARKYVMNLIKDINGRAGDVGSHPWLSKMTRMAKTASVAGNMRVMLLQITAYPRAGMVLSVDSLAKGLMRLPQIEKTKKYCGIALWKSFGFFDTNIARSIEDQIKGTKDIRAKLIELSMKGAEYADAITWGALWNACEYEVAKTTKNKVGSEEFYQEVGKKLREVVYATQVVDSVLTRSQLMRQKDGLTQMATAYMSEPTLTANILMDAGFQFEKAKRLGLPTKDAWKHLGRTIGVYTSVAVFTTLIESLADAIRDDDDDEEFGEKFVGALLPNMVSNVIPFNKLPIIADISDAVQSVFMGDSYYPTEIMSSQWITQSLYAINAWKSVLSGKDTPTTVYDALFKSMKAISFMTGLPISNVMRDLVAMWNTIVGSIDEELKLD